MMDPRPNDWSSFIESAGFAAPIPWVVANMGDGTYDEGASQFAQGEDIGIRTDWWTLPNLSVGQGGGGISYWPSYPTRASVPTIPTPGRGLPPPVYIPGPTATSAVPGGTPDGIYEAERDEEDWDAVYAEFERLNRGGNAEIDDGVFEPDVEIVMPDIWDLGRGLIDFFDDDPTMPAPVSAAQQYAPSSTVAGGGPVSSGPPGSTPTGSGSWCYNSSTGKWTKRRRRRRRLLTESDYNDLMRISTLPNKEGVRIALAKAIGRSR